MGQHRDSLRCLLLPLAGSNLLLPANAVVEVLPDANIEPVDGSPGWMLGRVEWRSVSVPLVSFEALAGGALPAPGQCCRVAVCRTLSGSGELDFHGLLLQGIPRIVQVRESELTLLQSESDSAPVLSRVEVRGQLAVIPDLERLEQHLHHLDGVSAPSVDIKPGDLPG